MPLTDSELEAIARDIESNRVERKSDARDSSRLSEVVCAFANDLPKHGRPGYLLVGVKDDGRPSGLEINERLINSLAAIRSDGNILPPPMMTVEKRLLDGTPIAVVEVFPSDAPPVRFKGQVYVRVAPSRAIANAQEERELAERRIDRERTWDMRPAPEAELDDLALDLFTLNYLPRAVAPDVLAANARSLVEQMAALRFYDLRKDRPNHAAVLVFGKDPLSFVPGAYVQYVRYAGSNQTTDVLEERRYSGDLRNILSGLDRLSADLSVPRPIRTNDLRDRTVFDYPPIALHELLMNAVIHRNYDGSSTPVSINQYADHIEIVNPGSLYGDLTPADFERYTAYRNPVLAEAAKTLGFVNRFGRGIAIARMEAARNESPPIELLPDENFFLTRVRKRL